MEKKDRARFFFGLDILFLSHELEKINEKDIRNDRASALIKRASIVYMNGGNRYRDMVYDVFNNALKEYQDWYHDNIYSVVMSNPTHLMEDGDDGPIPKYDVNKYDLRKYFDGLNKEVFEELQKLIFFLKDPDSEEVLNTFGKSHNSEDENFAEESINFWILAHSILVATLEGGEFLDRLEKIFKGYRISEEEFNEFNYFIGKILKESTDSDKSSDEIVNNITMDNLVKEFLSYPRNN